ncbi:hypothetical protein CoNPh11_CDS0158 [Staphylococcus phage S-CoN_Ph11]|nr:hypothetical protein CoNPh11_CDS0158 [Staphylococcus phage S-CoN_Ph11]
MEVLESFGGIEEGGYGIVTGHGKEDVEYVYLAGYDKFRCILKRLGSMLQMD